MGRRSSRHNDHFESVCYHPLFVFNPEGDCLAAKLRPGNVHSAEGWEEVLLPIIGRYRRSRQTVVVRADAAHQAASWNRPRRVIARVEHHLGELFPRMGFIVTNDQRGTAEQWIKGRQSRYPLDASLLSPLPSQ